MPTTTEPLKPWQMARDVTIVILVFGAIVDLATPPAAPERYLPVGRVQSIQFFGSLGVRSQVNTREAQGAERSFVVRQVSQLVQGQDVVLHVGRWRSELCNADHTVCEDLLGDPQ